MRRLLAPVRMQTRVTLNVLEAGRKKMVTFPDNYTSKLQAVASALAMGSKRLAAVDLARTSAAGLSTID